MPEASAEIIEHPTHRYVLWLGLLLLLVAGIYFIGMRMYTPAPAQEYTDPIQMVIPYAPEPTANDLVTAQQGFQYVISYTGTSFVPKKLSIRQGETIRFVNNSGQNVEIAYAYTTSPVIPSREYWEYAIPATTTDTFIYAAGDQTGTVTIE